LGANIGFFNKEVKELILNAFLMRLKNKFH
jgi:hypothetical protein